VSIHHPHVVLRGSPVLRVLMGSVPVDVIEVLLPVEVLDADPVRSPARTSAFGADRFLLHV